MATITVGAPGTLLPGFLKTRAARKLLVLAVVAAVLAPLANSRWPEASWPSALTVDLSKPLTSASNWIIRRTS